MATTTTKSSQRTRTPLTPEQLAHRKMSRLNWQIQGQLKSNRIAYLRVATMLAQIRDEKLHNAFKHDTIADYAREHLQLCESSLYDYLNVHDWVRVNRPAWLKPKPKGFIPEMSDIGILVEIDQDLAKTGLDSRKRARLEELRKEALEGRLTRKEFQAYRRRSVRRTESLAAILTTLLTVQRRAVRLASFPPEALKTLDATIQTVRNQEQLRVAGLHGIGARIQKLMQFSYA